TDTPPTSIFSRSLHDALPIYVLSFDASNPAASGFEQTKALNAKLTVNGIAITSQSNTLKDTIEGLEITLNKAGDEPINVEVAKDDSVATKAVKDYVDAYNKFNKSIRALTAYNVDLKQGAALTGDSMAREAQNAMRDATLGFVPGEGEIRSMVGLGINIDPKTGDLQLDEKKLNEVLKTNMADVKNMFVGENSV